MAGITVPDMFFLKEQEFSLIKSLFYSMAQSWFRDQCGMPAQDVA
jgi:hypothetical protein